MSAIRPLDLATVRLLSSSIVIISPDILVKELVDNAIDAEATSIEVNISPNTVDKIQVKDNGRGINMDDFELLGRQAHTSKLRKFSELQKNNLPTIGFRGQALASANCVGIMTIVTRTAKDILATRLKITPNLGGIATRSPSSGPVGTTIRVEKLFGVVPVRRQQALKECRKCIARIQNLLRGYAMARPHLKLSFRVLAEPKHNWYYTPSLTPSTREATMQIFGKDLAVGCEAVQADLVGKTADTQTLCTIEALLPRSDCELNQVSGKGAFISVDSKPLSSATGFGKRLTSIFKTQFRAATEAEAFGSKLSAPFARVNIKCTGILYDSNVTPLKDDVLFPDEIEVMDLFKTMCQGLYGKGRSPEHMMVTSLRLSPSRGELACHVEDQERRRASSTIPQATRSQCEVVTQTDADNYVQMRTYFRVNLGRTNSAETDEAGLSDTIMMRMPLQPLIVGKCSAMSSGSGKVATKRHQPPILQDLHQYLQPMKQIARKLSFEIATDDTATEELPPDGQDISSVTTSSGSDRQPLQPLSEFMVNTFDTGTDEDLRHSVSAPRPAPSLPQQSTRQSLASEPRPEPAYESTTPLRGFGALSAPVYTPQVMSPPHLNSPMGFDELPTTYSSPTSNDAFLMPTPPRFDARITNRHSNPQFRSPLLQLASAQPENGRLDGLGSLNTVLNDISGGDLQNLLALSMPDHNPSPLSHVPVQPLLPSGAPHDDVSSERRASILRIQDHPRIHRSSDIPKTEEKPMDPFQHRSQITEDSMTVEHGDSDQSLMRRLSSPTREASNPNSAASYDSLANREGAIDQSNWEEYSIHGTGQHEQGRANSVMDQDLVFDTGDDAREQAGLLTSSPEEGAVRRGQSTPVSKQSGPRAVVYKLEVLEEDVYQLLEHLATTDAYATEEWVASYLDFKSVSEAMEIDAMLRATVETWVRKAVVKPDVSYTLLSQFKGKGKA